MEVHPEAIELEARLATLLRGMTGRSDERAVLALLDAASAPALGSLSAVLDFGRLLGRVDDHRTGDRNRSALLQLLCRDRLADLPPAGRARLVAALQRGRTSRLDEQAIVDVLCGCAGEDLFETKRAIDRMSTYRDVHQLVFVDVDDGALRERLLAHLASEARRSPAERRGLRVVSDVDDTLWANWKDARYPKKTVYPGVRAFYRELARPPEAGARRPGELVFLTARPRDRAGLVEGLTHRTLRRLGVEGASVLSGPLRRVFSSASIARGKIENFRSYRAVYPEDDFAFVGDSGQGDVHVAVALREEASDVVRGAFIHDVVATNEPERARLAARGVDLFDSYAGAAAHAARRGLLDRAAAQRVAGEARAELSRVKFADRARAEAARAWLGRDAAWLDPDAGKIGGEHPA